MTQYTASVRAILTLREEAAHFPEPPRRRMLQQLDEKLADLDRWPGHWRQIKADAFKVMEAAREEVAEMQEELSLDGKGEV